MRDHDVWSQLCKNCKTHAKQEFSRWISNVILYLKSNVFDYFEAHLGKHKKKKFMIWFKSLYTIPHLGIIQIWLMRWKLLKGGYKKIKMQTHEPSLSIQVGTPQLLNILMCL